MRESFKYGSVRGAVSNDRPYRDNRLFKFWSSLWAGGDFEAEFFGRGTRPCFIAKRRAAFDAAADCCEFCLCLRRIDILQSASIAPQRPCRQKFLFRCRS